MYCIVENGIILNIIVSDKTFADSIGALESYDGASIGSKYDPPIPVSRLDKIEAQVAYTAMMTDTLIGGQNEG